MLAILMAITIQSVSTLVLLPLLAARVAVWLPLLTVTLAQACVTTDIPPLPTTTPPPVTPPAPEPVMAPSVVSRIIHAHKLNISVIVLHVR
jgi:hypothetical protein